MLSLHYEYRVMPAPRRAAGGAKTAEARFALALTEMMNAMGREGWEYQRADTLPLDERSGLTGTKTSYQNMLIFRRVLVAHTPAYEPANEDMGYDDIFDVPLSAPKKPRRLAAE